MRGGRWRRPPRRPKSASARARSGSGASAAKVRAGCSTAPRRQVGPHRTPEDRVVAIAALRRLRMTGAEIAFCLGMALSTVSAVLRSALHVDVKKLGRILSPGHRVVGHRRSEKKVGPKAARRGRLVSEHGHQTRTGALRQRLPLRSTPLATPAASIACASASPALTGPGQTEKPSASSRRSPTAGPTARSTRPRPNAQPRSPAG